jgi:two-component system cell cycle sensor histidine kinase/response regulator CckA
MSVCEIVTGQTRTLDSPGAESVAPRAGDRSIVLAEDEPVVREFMAAALRQTGYTVLEAGNGEEALQIFWKCVDRKIDLLLTDIVMPVMGGKELAYNVGRYFPDIKILFCSAYPEKLADRNEMLDRRYPFLQKPVTGDALRNKVRELLIEEPATSPESASDWDEDLPEPEFSA